MIGSLQKVKCFTGPLFRDHYIFFSLRFGAPFRSRFLGSSSQSNTEPSIRPDPEKQVVPLVKKVWGDPVPHEVLKNIKTEYHGAPPNTYSDDLIWIPIYRMPYIIAWRWLVKSKLLLSLSSGVVCIYKLTQFFNNHEMSLLFTALMSLSSLAGLVLAGEYSRRLICQIYVTEDLKFVRLTRLSFFARRIDLIVPRSVLYPLTENNTTWTKFLCDLETVRPPKINPEYDQDEFYDQKFKICLKYGGVRDRERFDSILGTILDMKY